MLTPKIDELTEKINLTNPSLTEDLSPLVRRNVTENAIGEAKGAICNKIDGAVNLVQSIKSGAAGIIDGVKDFNLGSLNVNGFFEGPITDLKNKFGGLFNSFNSLKGKFSIENLANQIKIDGILGKLDNQLTQRFESGITSSKGFTNSLGGIAGMSNSVVKSLTTKPDFNSTFKSLACKQASDDLVGAALNQKSITKIASQQDILIANTVSLIEDENSENSILGGIDLPNINL